MDLSLFADTYQKSSMGAELTSPIPKSQSKFKLQNQVPDYMWGGPQNQLLIEVLSPSRAGKWLADGATAMFCKKRLINNWTLVAIHSSKC